MANTAFTTTEADQFLLDLWADQVENVLQRNLVFTGVFSDAKTAYPKVGSARGFQNLFITKTGLLNSGSARTKTEGNDQLLVYDKETGTPVTLTINQWKYLASEFEDFAQALAGFDLQDAYMPDMVEVIARDFDAFLAGFPDNFATNIVGTLATPNSESELLEAMQLLGDNDVPMDGRTWVFSERAFSLLNSVVKYKSVDYRPGEGGTKTYDIPVIYDVPVVHSPGVEGTNAAGHDNTLTHRSAVTYYRVGDAPRIRNVMAEDNLSDKVSISNIYGGVEVFDARGVWVKGA